MKKAIWIASILPLIITAFLLRFLPDSVPMHYDISGQIDRWGSKNENLIFPLFIFAMALFFQLLISHFEKKSARAETEKEQKEAASNVKFLRIIALWQTIAFGVMQLFILYGAYVAASPYTTLPSVDIATVSCFSGGVLFLIIGNYLPKARKNSLVGLRTVWSMYNDTTWTKSNRFAAGTFIVTGVLTMVTSLLASSSAATSLMLGYLAISAVLTTFYSYKVYKTELSKK